MAGRAFSLAIALAALVLDLIAASNAVAAETLTATLLPHGVASLLATFTLPLLPLKYTRPRVPATMFVVALAFFIPVGGLLGLLFFVVPALHWPVATEPEQWCEFEVPPLPGRSLFVGPDRTVPQSEGALLGQLRYVRNTSTRMSAVMAARQLGDVQAISLLRVATRDPADDVRLLAYAMLDRKDQRLNTLIQEQLALLKTSPANAHPGIHSQLAHLYWEMAYVGLATGDLLNSVLGLAEEHAVAGSAGGDGAEQQMLLGKIRLRRSDADGAEQAFLQAKAMGLSDIAIAPYLAEVAFLQRRFDLVQQRVARMPEQRRKKPPLKAVSEYWLEAA